MIYKLFASSRARKPFLGGLGDGSGFPGWIYCVICRGNFRTIREWGQIELVFQIKFAIEYIAERSGDVDLIFEQERI